MTYAPPLSRAALLLAAVAVATLTACGADEPSAQATAITPAAAATSAPPAGLVDNDRAACHQLSESENSSEGVLARFDPAIMQPIADVAIQATDPAIRAAGGKLIAAFAHGRPEPGQPAVDAQQASLELAEACAAKYGDGPW